MNGLLFILMQVADSTSVKSIVKEFKMKDLSEESIHSMLKLATDQLFKAAINIIFALIVFAIGRWLIKRIWTITNKVLEKREVDSSLKGFLRNMINIILNILLIITIIGILGIETSSFVAIFASAGLGISMAMSGTLQNFASGVIVLLQKPYRVGDIIEVLNNVGTVKEIQIFSTIISTPDNKTIYIPNGQITSGVINNYSKAGIRRVEWIFSIAYGNNVDIAKAILHELIKHDARITNEPFPPLVALHKLNASSVDIIVRAWTSVDVFWDVFWDLNEKVYKRFPTEGLSIPFNQLDVNLRQTPTKES